MDTENIARELLALLPKLYDSPHADDTSAWDRLTRSSPRRGATTNWRDLVLALIEGLKPDASLPVSSRPWRNYQYLTQRYVQLHSVKEISRALGISERQSQRINVEAMEALAAELHSSLGFAERPDGRSSATGPERDSPTPAESAPELARSEVARLADASIDRRVSLDELVASVMATVANMAEERRTIVSVDLPPDLPPVVAERTLLRQGLLGLLVACLTGGAKQIDLGGAGRSGGGDSVELWVRASAEGWSSGTAGLYAKISDDRSLRMALDILHSQGSAVSLSEESPGSFLIRATLPSARVPSLLVADDNPDTVRLYRRYLGNASYQLAEAATGERAFEMARQLKPVAIILDVMMPGQDGWETLQKLHNHPETKGIPVIMCSVIDQRDLALSLGAFELLPKPISRMNLLETLDRCLRATLAR